MTKHLLAPPSRPAIPGLRFGDTVGWRHRRVNRRRTEYKKARFRAVHFTLMVLPSRFWLHCAPTHTLPSALFPLPYTRAEVLLPPDPCHHIPPSQRNAGAGYAAPAFDCPGDSPSPVVMNWPITSPLPSHVYLPPLPPGHSLLPSPRRWQTSYRPPTAPRAPSPSCSCSAGAHPAPPPPPMPTPPSRR